MVLMKQGLPQGYLLSPLLLLFYIKNLTESLPDDITAAMLAVDASLIAIRSQIEDAQANIQEGTKAVVCWHKAWKLNLSAGKSKRSLFSTVNTDAGWRSTITCDGVAIKYKDNLHLLEVPH